MNTFNGQVRSVTANVAKKTATVTFELALTEETMPVLESLGFVAGKTPVTVVVSSKQITMDITKKLNDQANEG